MSVFQVSDATWYHTGQSERDEYYRRNKRSKPPEPGERMVISWDMEGISLSGQNIPQHPVLFGCSAVPDERLRGKNVSTRDMLGHIIDVSQRFPHAIHVGFGFRYDANMIIKGLRDKTIAKLWQDGEAKFRMDRQWQWYVRWIPGKMFTVSRKPCDSPKKTRAKQSVTIYDYSSFFGGQNFITTSEQILREDLTDDDRTVIEHGKAARGQQSWEDMPEIEHYWRAEIQLIRRVFEKFRDVMQRAGFHLKQWYGPGALANYLNAQHDIRAHLAGVQTTSGIMPDAVHHASKVAFTGGRFELYQAGRVQGPLYSADINSAYPHALRMLPSFADGNGRWVHTDNPERIERFGFYRVRFTAPRAQALEYRPMPLPFRDARGMISYPQTVHGWYASPEVAAIRHMNGVDILEGWYWESWSDERPWQFLEDMFATRKRLGKQNLMSLPFKLGPNSLYGKYAQTIGWDSEKLLPPKSHALPVAAWITSYCRAMLWRVMVQVPSHIVAVETDSIVTTVDPRTLNVEIGDELGEWDVTEYDELLYMQSGTYHYKQGGVWSGVRSRGMNKSEYPYEHAARYLETLNPGEHWPSMQLETKPRFIGAGAALNSAAPLKTIHCSWRAQEKEITLGDTGKRVHVPKACPQCRDGIAPDKQAHRLAIKSRSDGQELSHPRTLPWEREYTSEVQEIRDRITEEKELLDG